MLQDAMRATLTETESARVTALLAEPPMVKLAEDYLAGEYVQVAGQIPLGGGRWLQCGVYCVVRWHADHVELMRHGQRKRIEVPHGVTLAKYPLELLVLSERAAARVVVDGDAAGMTCHDRGEGGE